MLLSDYCSLSKDIKTLATRYWLSVILEHLNLQNVNQLSKATQQLKGVHRSAQCSASFLYKKMKESAIESEAKIKLMNVLVPGSSLCLTNPLWALLDSDRIDIEFANTIIFSLNAHITACLFEPMTDMAYPKRTKLLTKSQIKTIASFNSPDALTCLLALSLVHQNKKIFLEKHAYQMFVRLTIFTPLKSIRSELYEIIRHRFYNRATAELNDHNRKLHYDSHLCRFYKNSCIELHSSFVSVPFGYFDELNKLYSTLTNDMVSLGLIKNTPYQKMLFIQEFDNTDRGWIFSGICNLKNGRDLPAANRCLSELLDRMNYISRYQ